MNQQVLPTSFNIRRLTSRRTSQSGCITMPTCRIKRIVKIWHSSLPAPPQSTSTSMGQIVQCIPSRRDKESREYLNLETRWEKYHSNISVYQSLEKERERKHQMVPQRNTKVCQSYIGLTASYAWFCAGDNYYSARLYRSVEHQGAVSAVFCMSLYHPLYIEV